MGLRAVLAATLLVIQLPASSNTFQGWVRQLETRGIQVTAGCWDIQTRKLVEGHQVDLDLIPASTTKVVSTYAMLKVWKPDHQLETEVWGELVQGTVQGDLVVKGAGDPFLTPERLWMMAEQLKARGVKRVTGRIRLDQSAFDDQRYEPTWSDTSFNTTPPILPLSVGFNREDGRLTRDPEGLALETLNRIWTQAGLVIEGGTTPGGTPRRLLAFPSPPLRSLAADINKFSNNFMTEMLVKRFGEGSWPGAIQRIQDFYQAVLGLGPDRIRISDGSGLSKANRLSARTLGTVLQAAWHDFEVGPEFVASLKNIGGEPWTLKVKDPNLARRVRCKTGRLANVDSVCGYVQLPDGRTRIFAIILNGPSSYEDVWAQISRWANP